MCFRSSLKACRSSSLAKYFPSRAQIVMVSTTRPISCLTLRSRVGVPRVPRKYFETTMFVASWDQNLGISTSRCSKTTSPFSLPMTADRSSHSISSNGSTPSREKYREYSSPGAVLALVRTGISAPTTPACCAMPLCMLLPPPDDRAGPAAALVERTVQDVCPFNGQGEAEQSPTLLGTL